MAHAILFTKQYLILAHNRCASGKFMNSRKCEEFPPSLYFVKKAGNQGFFVMKKPYNNGSSGVLSLAFILTSSSSSPNLFKAHFSDGFAFIGEIRRSHAFCCFMSDFPRLYTKN